ncbi:hypothetical protein EKTHUN627_41730 [Enterobacter kobei]|nr:hypothetical protein EKTHUN627_41730 [Enterobacter kobei]
MAWEISSCRVAASPYPAYKTENTGRVSAAPPGNKGYFVTRSYQTMSAFKPC